MFRIRCGKARWTDSGHDRPEASHGHQVDLVGHKGGGHGRSETVPIEVGTEAAEAGPVDQLGSGSVLPGQLEARTGPVRKHGADGQARLEHRPQDRPGTRDKDREAHPVNLVGTGSGPARRQGRRNLQGAEVAKRCLFNLRRAPTGRTSESVPAGAILVQPSDNCEFCLLRFLRHRVA